MLKVILWILLTVIAVVLLLVLIAVIKTLLTPAKTSPWTVKSDPEREEAYARKLSAMIRYETESRKGEIQKAVQLYMNSCNQNSSYVYRGNLDPEISALIKQYGLNKQDDEDVW